MPTTPNFQTASDCHMRQMTVHQLILVALLLLADPAAAGKKKKAQPKPDEVEIPLDSPPVHSSEANASGPTRWP